MATMRALNSEALDSRTAWWTACLKKRAGSWSRIAAAEGSKSMSRSSSSNFGSGRPSLARNSRAWFTRLSAGRSCWTRGACTIVFLKWAKRTSTVSTVPSVKALRRYSAAGRTSLKAARSVTGKSARTLRPERASAWAPLRPMHTKTASFCSAARRIRLPLRAPAMPLSGVTRRMPRTLTSRLVRSGWENSPTLAWAVSRISPSSSA